MAEAPGHRLGQIIGGALELAVKPILLDFAAKHDLYLDSIGKRPARSGKKVRWTDDLGNSHDLDFVLERGGSDDATGVPVAFVESAWRRYTKHSKAKAQEMQAAVMPLIAKYADTKPFAGVILGGEFTEQSVKQLESSGFAVLHVSYDEIAVAFDAVGMDVRYDEKTPDEKLRAQIDNYEALDDEDLNVLGEALRAAVSGEIREFVEDLAGSVLRRVTAIAVLPLHGSRQDFTSIADAVDLLTNYTHPDRPGPLDRFEVILRYDNGDRITAEFGDADDAVAFLKSFD